MAADGLINLVPAARLAVDTAALVLIWLVQLVIYPVFLHLEATAFANWHPVYTARVTYVVAPIMLGQLSFYVATSVFAGDWSVYVNLGLVLLAWVITFFAAVPLHQLLDQPGDHLVNTGRLLTVNWLRTIIWSLVWAVTLVRTLRATA